jgi:hypothetical protein
MIRSALGSPSRGLAAAIALAAAVSAPGRAQEVRTTDFTWRQPLGGAFITNGVYRAQVTAETWDGCVYGPDRDLRLFDAEGQAWPFFLWAEPGRPSEEALPAVRRNEIDQLGARQFELRLDGPVDRGHDRIRIEFADAEYMRHVEIFGREREEDEWGRLGGGFVVRIPRAPPLREDVIEYAPSTFRHLRIRIHPDLRRPGEEVPPAQARVVRAAGLPAPRMHTVFAVVPPGPDERADGPGGRQVVFFDAGHDLPFEEIEVRAGGAYARDVTLYSRPAGTNLWSWAGHGRIVRHADAEFARIPVAGRRARYWKAEIERGDDEPLDRVTAAGYSPVRWMVFEAKSAGPVHAYFGAQTGAAPRFDLERRTARPAQAEVVTLGPRAANAAFQPARPLPRWIIPAGIGLASLLVLGVIVRMARDLMRQR